jgi:DNA-binding NarL/FixJ family response regulator
VAARRGPFRLVMCLDWALERLSGTSGVWALSTIQRNDHPEVRVIRVAIADDDPSVRTALTEVLQADPRFEVVGAVSNGDDLVRLVVDTRPDLVVLDVRMPRGGAVGARALREATADGGTPVPVVVALSAQSSVGTVVAMLREGVSGYLVKGQMGSELPDLLVRAAGGEVVLAGPTGSQALRHVIAVAK